LISFSDCRVLGELHPGPTQSVRDRQSTQYQLKGGLQGTQASSLHASSLTRWPHIQPEISSKPVSGETHGRLANPWPIRLALQLEAHRGQSTLFSNVPRQPESLTMRKPKLKAVVAFRLALGLQVRRTNQEIFTKTWQKN